MKHLAILIIIFLFGNSFLFAQNTSAKLIDKDKTKYEENVFNQEFDKYQDTTNATRKLYDRIPDKLPTWVFKPVEFGNINRIVGFSDPNMNKKEAYEQAVLRAKAMFALLNYCTVSNITDDYTNIYETGKNALYSTKFQDFSTSKTLIAYNNSDINVIDTFYTKYNEGIVLIEFNRNSHSEKNVDTLEVKGDNMQVFIERNFRKEKLEFFNLFIKDNLANNTSADLVAQYNYKIVNRSYDISSIYDKKNIEFEERTYNYRTDLEFSKDSSDTDFKYYSLNRGLWNAYISGVLSNIMILSKQLSSKVKNTNDFYTLKNEGLVRTVARNKVVFDFNDFKMCENHFYIDLNGKIK